MSEVESKQEPGPSGADARTEAAIKLWAGAAGEAKAPPPATAAPEAEEAKAEEHPAEKAAVEKAAPEPEGVDLAGKIAELARRDRELQSVQRQLRAEASKVKEAEALLRELKADPLGVLLKSGIDISSVLDSISGKGESSEPRIDPRIDQLSKEVEALKAHSAKSTKDQLYNRELGKIHGLISTDPEQFEAVLERVNGGSLDDVFTALNAIYQQTGRMPDEDDYVEAARVVEEVYRQEETERIKQLAAAKRHAGKLSLGEGSAVKAESTSAKAAKPKAPAKTLTSELTREPPIRKQKLTEEERFAAAVELAKQLALS